MASSSEAPFAPAVRVGDHAWVSGAVALDQSGQVVGADTNEQARTAFANMSDALAGVQMTLSNVVQTRIFLTPNADWKAVARVFKEAFADVRPAATMVRVHSLALPELLLEIEATAVIRK
ncbi:Rid family hydrolase [Rhodococcus erythropolis]|jgi:enamine deaminase RidA (YjgF/YER057c/UK114 family)|uniref:Rid family hydrolase n=1 Tax=Rhodococcus erythropolis TaxID=1833 RepID=UPI0008788C8E|nr:Rid family hydrolase [Rhodococcus erythropolis]MDF2467747.1 RidA family protein [Rhodococcus erythropolis]OFV75258.1 2-aminomuconate deaminase [Rhodococcus erythropolis]